MSATKIKAEALKILTGPGGPCDIFAENVKMPDMLLQIIKETLDDFVSQNPQPPGTLPEDLADAFLRHVAERKKASP
jgi:hypothetical protein